MSQLRRRALSLEIAGGPGVIRPSFPTPSATASTLDVLCDDTFTLGAMMGTRVANA